MKDTYRVLRVGRVHQMVINKLKAGDQSGPEAFRAVHEHVTCGTITSSHRPSETQRLRALKLA